MRTLLVVLGVVTVTEILEVWLLYRAGCLPVVREVLRRRLHENPEAEARRRRENRW